MSRFHLRAKAKADLADIWHYTAKRGNVEQAERYIRGINQAMGELADNPLLGRPYEDFPGYRRRIVGSHVVFFRVADDVVDIVRIFRAGFPPPPSEAVTAI